MTDSKDREISELRSRIARLDDALRQSVLDAAEWARKAGEAQGKLEISEAAGILDGWKRDCERLRADNARLREAGNELGGYAGHDDSCACVKGWATGPCNCGYTDTWNQWTAALQGTSHDA